MTSSKLMALLLCPRCQRANPGEAQFCHFDGSELHVGPGGSYRGSELGRDFVFPSGRRCRSFDDLVRGCVTEWESARNMLKQGGLRQFMAGIGRMDLAMAADKASTHSDLDIGLDQFLAQLPTRESIVPRLELDPRRINLGRLLPGETRQVELTIANQGTRLLHGTLQRESEDWLSVGEGNPRQLPLKIEKEQKLTASIDTFGLVAGQKYLAKLTVITNGGVAEVPVAMELASVPFAHPPMQGIATARDLAAKMREVPKQAAPLLENGEVQRWFAANGWRYPVQGAQAKGVAAVQQFFEGMGLSKPPPLAVSDQQILIECRAGQTALCRVVLKTTARKWVFGRIESDSSWLVVKNPDISGAQQAVAEFEAVSRGLETGRLHEAHLTITANGGQKFTIGVFLDVHVMPAKWARTIARAVLLGGLGPFTLRLLGSIPDLLGRGMGGFGGWLTGAPEDYLANYVGYFTLTTAWLGAPLGGWLLWRQGGKQNPHDLVAGALVGFVTALALTATLGCLYPLADRLLFWLLPGTQPGLALAGWALVGASLALLVSLLGSWGRSIMTTIAQPFAWLARRLDLPKLADFLTGTSG